MKIGQRTRCPITGTPGWVCKFIGEWAICRADDGSYFKRENGPAKPRRAAPPQPKPRARKTSGVAWQARPKTYPSAATCPCCGRLAVVRLANGTCERCAATNTPALGPKGMGR